MSDLYPNKQDKETTEIVADYFAKISDTFIPINDADVQHSKGEERIKISAEDWNPARNPGDYSLGIFSHTSLDSLQ